MPRHGSSPASMRASMLVTSLATSSSKRNDRLVCLDEFRQGASLTPSQVVALLGDDIGDLSHDAASYWLSKPRRMASPSSSVRIMVSSAKRSI